MIFIDGRALGRIYIWCSAGAESGQVDLDDFSEHSRTKAGDGRPISSVFGINSKPGGVILYDTQTLPPSETFHALDPVCRFDSVIPLSDSKDFVTSGIQNFSGHRQLASIDYIQEYNQIENGGYFSSALLYTYHGFLRKFRLLYNRTHDVCSAPCPPTQIPI